MQHPAWIVILLGAITILVGLLWLLGPSWLGRLPGDIYLEGENFRFYFPLTTCILISLLVSGILWLVRFFLG